jgi:hypothetical protein
LEEFPKVWYNEFGNGRRNALVIKNIDKCV